MKNINRFRFLFTLLGVLAPFWAPAQTVFFTDNFSSSTTNQVSIPGGTATASYTSYDIASTKNGIPNSFIQPNDLRLSLSGVTTSGFLEAQALFTANPFELNSNTDYIDIAVVFTNTLGTNILDPGLTSALWIGLYNSGSTPGVITNWPVAGGGLDNAGLAVAASDETGNCQPWEGYIAQINGGSANLYTRPAQSSATTSDAQELLGDFAASAATGTYQNPSGIQLEDTARTTLLTPGALTAGQPYLVDLRITLQPLGVLVVSNSLYQGTSTATGTILFSQIGYATTTNSSFLVSSFDGLAIGLRASTTPATDPLIDISSIAITGQSSAITGPPTIAPQPTAVEVATNGTCAFSLSAIGSQVTYQWYRNNTPLSNGGNISGATSSQLIITNCTTADSFSGPNGYYCLVSGAGPFSTNSTTNALILQPATNLVWGGEASKNLWDVNNTVNFYDTNGNPQVFNYGDPVTVDDTAGGGTLNLDSPYIASPTVTVNSTLNYTMMGGSLAGPGNFVYEGTGRLTLNANNIYTGGTLISNANSYVLLQGYSSFGSGPVVLAGGQMEVALSGSAGNGFPGTTVIASNYTMLVDEDTAFGVVFLGDISGSAGQTLTFSPGENNLENGETNTYRIRTYGNATVCNAQLQFTDPDNNIIFAPSQASGTEIYDGAISGNGALYTDCKGLLVLNGQNTYTGGTVPAEGSTGLGASTTISGGSIVSGPIGTGPLLLVPDSSSLTANAVVLAYSNNITLANPIEYPSGTNNFELEVGGTNNITFSGLYTLNGNDGLTTNTFPARMVENTNIALTTFSGIISDGGLNYALTVNGNGTNFFAGPVILSATNTYTGPTTNSGADLLINGQVGPGELVVTTNGGTLGGIGTITGPVIISSNGVLTAGTQLISGVPNIGTLTISNNLTLLNSSTNRVKVNLGNSPTSDSFFVSGAVAYNGVLVATNLGSAIPVNTQFHIYTAGSESGNFTSVSGSPGPGLGWQFIPATGILTVVSVAPPPFTVSPAITNITLSGSNVILSGTNGQSGDVYYLLTATNLTTPISQWTPVATNIAGGNLFSFTATNALNSKDAQQFFRFANTNF